MSVKLISYTKPVFDSNMQPEEIIAYCARVSNPENQNNTQTSSKLLKYLIKHKHWSPFEMVDVCFEIKTSRYISQQMIRHRSFSFQEFSQRYSNATHVTDTELRKQSTKNRQSSQENITDLELIEIKNKSIQQSLDTYNTLIEKGVAREVARSVLPLAVETTLYMKGSLRSWIHYLELRCDETTQIEHRKIATAIKKELYKIFPNVFEQI